MSKRKKAIAFTFDDFLCAAAHDHAEARRMLHLQPGLIRERDSTGETALHYLAVERDLEAARFLLAHGAQVDSRDHSDSTPLMHAAQLGHESIARLLIEHGANVNARNNCDDTPLHFAARGGSVELLDFLFQIGGRVDEGEREHFVEWELLPRKRESLLEVLRRHGLA